MELLKIDRSLTSRYLNDGFSGGEKKRLEILQMAMLQPQIAILDETDSGLDIDALRIVSEGVNALVGPGDGRARDHALPAPPRTTSSPTTCTSSWMAAIVRSGGPELAHELERDGYDAHRRRGGGMSGARTELAPRGAAASRSPSATYKYGFHDEENPVFKTGAGWTRTSSREISAHKNEPEWMLDFRLKALRASSAQADAAAGAPTSPASTSRTSSTT